MNVNPLRIERLLRMAIVPFLSAGALVGTGFSLWVFTATAESDPVSVKGNLSVLALAELGEIEVAEPEYHEAYRIVFEQGGETAINDETKGVYMTPAISCTLDGIDWADETMVKGFNVYFELKAYQIVNQVHTHEDYTGTCSVLTSAEVSEANSEQNKMPLLDMCTEHRLNTSNGTLTFSVQPTLIWKSNQKPRNSSGWANLVSSVNSCSDHYHVLSIVVDNGIDTE